MCLCSVHSDCLGFPFFFFSLLKLPLVEGGGEETRDGWKLAGKSFDNSYLHQKDYQWFSISHEPLWGRKIEEKTKATKQAKPGESKIKFQRWYPMQQRQPCQKIRKGKCLRSASTRTSANWTEAQAQWSQIRLLRMNTYQWQGFCALGWSQAQGRVWGWVCRDSQWTHNSPWFYWKYFRSAFRTLCRLWSC